MKNSLKAHLALLGAQVIYGANYSISKEAMPEYVQPFAFILLRVSGAAILLWATSFFVKEKMEKQDLRKILLLALFGVAVNQLLFFKGLDLSKPINASIMMISNPIFVLILTAFILKEKITGNRIAGIVLGIAGALTLLLMNKDFSFGPETLLGDSLILINSASWGLYTILVKPLMKKYHTITVLKWTFAMGLIYVLPFGYSELGLIDWQHMPVKIMICILFVVVFTTYVAYLLNTFALRDLSPTVVSFYIYLQPFLASLFAVYMGKDSIDWVKIVSAILIIGGVYMVSKPPAQQKRSIANT